MNNKSHYLIITLLCFTLNSYAQIDSTLIKATTGNDTSKISLMNLEAIHNRPFTNIGNTSAALGGYMESNWQYLSTEGVSEGHHFQFRRFTLFTSATITNRIKFLAEIEFEDGAKEIAIEFAALDVELSPLFNLRGGMIVNPIGAFNENHDGPKWEFTDRPLAMTNMLPATWSTPGFGIYGKKSFSKWMASYEFYLSSGFDNSIIENSENKTFLPAAKQNINRFEKSENGAVFTTTKFAIKNNKWGEIGISHMGGVYNKYRNDGINMDDKRRVNIYAIDLNTEIPNIKTSITSEFAWIFVNVPETYSQQFGTKQQGGFIDIVQPLYSRKVLNWNNATLNLSLRVEYVDWNKGRFKETDHQIGDETWSLMPGISFRPSPKSVFRLNYRYLKERDIFRNTPERTDGLIFGISTYF